MLVVVGFVIIQTIVFTIVILILRRLMYKDTMSAVNRLKLVDEDNVKRMDGMKQKIREAEEEYRRKMEQTAEDVRKQREEAMKETAKEKEKILVKAREESDRIVSSAKKLEVRAGQRIAMELEMKGMEFAGKLVRTLFSTEIEKILDGQLVNELIAEIENMDAGRLSVDVGEVGITTRYPLNAAHKTKIKSIMEKKMGHKVDLREEVKEGMIGGIILKLGSLILDGSLENKIKEAMEELKHSNT